EPELMTDPEQAAAYAGADFSEPHQAFIAHFQHLFPEFCAGCVLDLGCGAADVTIRFARTYPEARIDGVEGAVAMLELGRRAVARAALNNRIALIESRLPDASFDGRNYDAIICNSLLHHLADPNVLWQTVRMAARRGAPLLVMDLLRPQSAHATRALVKLHAADAPAILQRDFYNSLRAAYRPDEVAAQLQMTGFKQFKLSVVSDRHWIVWGKVEENEL
ncbi:MAG: methyltransferase type 12, partial [Betaproteobacteria bacterium RIFCSPLOWO2_12_FULL_62_13]